jgi:hypothetical protein
MRPTELSSGGSPGLLAPLLLIAIAAVSGWIWRRMPDERARDTGYRGLPNRCTGALTVAVAGIALAVAVASLAGSGGAARAVELALFGIFIAGMVLIPVTWIAWRPRWLLPPSLRRSLAAGAGHGSRASSITHHVTVMYVDPPAGHADAGKYQPYYVALCSCDHLGPDPRDTADQAFADARAHSADVDPVVQRPLDHPRVPGG